MFIVIQIVHVLVSLTLILFILLQTGKGSDLGAMLGGGGSNTLFGAGGATSFLSKLTRYAAVVFMLTCLALAYISAHPATAMENGASVMPDKAATTDTQQAAPADSDDATAQDEAAPADSDDAAAQTDTEEAAPADSDDAVAKDDAPTKEGATDKEATKMEPKAEAAGTKDDAKPQNEAKTE